MKLSYTIVLSATLSLASISPSFSMDPNEVKQTVPQKKNPSMVKSTFPFEGKNIDVDLAYPYVKINPKTTRFFFEGEVVLIDPLTTPFEYFVTSPLLPCLFGHIYDSTSRKSLVFHKYVYHGMDSLLPFYEKLGVTEPEKLNVSLYGCAMSPQKFEADHKKFYQGTTQTKELIGIKNFFKDIVKIPEGNIEIKFFKNNMTIPIIGEYQNVATTVGVTKTGEIFHTSVVVEDIFGLEDLKLPSCLSQYKKFSKCPGMEKVFLVTNTSSTLSPIIRTHFVASRDKVDNSKLGELNFFSSEQLDVPAPDLKKLFSLKCGRQIHSITAKNPFGKK